MFSHSNQLRSLHHDGSERYVTAAENNRGGCYQLGDTLTIRLRVHPGNHVKKALLRITPDGEQTFIELQKSAGKNNERCEWWATSLKLTMPVTNYRFLVFTTEGAYWYNSRGLQETTPTDFYDFRILANYNAPNWVTDSVFYQIFPDRFCCGNPRHGVRDGEFIHDGTSAHTRTWGETPTRSGQKAMVEFFNGDLTGIAQKLDYLAELGVNAIYLNPIFPAFTNHRYDVIDYFQVDQHLGGKRAFCALRQKLRERGIRLVLDIVPNHCGSQHHWFRAAQADPHSKTAQYFNFYKHPDDYECWLGEKNLPRLNYANRQVRRLMYGGKRSVFRHWLREPYAIDGWRIDVANMLARSGAQQLNLEIAREIRQAVKQENPTAYLLGENFFDATATLQGDAWDGVMNYSGFTRPLWHWLNEFSVQHHGQPNNYASGRPLSTAGLLAGLEEYRAAIPWQIASQQYNLLDSHDTPRIRHTIGEHHGRNRLAATLLLTYVGVPGILYGTEVGLQGDIDTLTRGCMPWDERRWDMDCCNDYRKLIRLRHESRALARGGFQILQTEQDSFAFLRDAEGESVIVIANRGPNEKPAFSLSVAEGAIPDGAQFMEVFSGAKSTVTGGILPQPKTPVGATIWRWVD